MTTSTLAGQFLVSMPRLRGDYFQSSVTLLVEHDEQGAFGLVVNKPIDITLAEVFDQMSDTRIPVLQGGPVEPDRIFFLHSADRTYDDSFSIAPNLLLSTSPELIRDISNGHVPQHTVALVGYAGWAPDQLDDEIRNDAWLVAPYDEAIMFSNDYREKPQAAARLLGIDLNLVNPTSGHG